MSSLIMPRDREKSCRRFYGLGDGTQDGPGYFSRAHNISSRAFPHAASCDDRYAVCDLPDTEIYPFSSDEIGWLCGDGSLYYGGERIEGWSHFDGSASWHRAVMIGTKAVFFPDKAWFDTETGECGYLGFSRTSNDSRATATICFTDGVYPSSMTYGLTEPTEPTDNALWTRKDLSNGSFVVYRWVEAVGEWERQDKLLYRVFFDFAGRDVTAGERLDITACRTEDTEIGELVGQHRIARVEHSAVYFECEPDRKLLPRICRKTSHSVVLTLFTMERRIPDLLAVCSAGGRLWGIDSDGSTVRASAPGDPFSWYSFDGYGGDSFAQTTAYPGSYTGICAVGDMPVLFKSDRLIRIQGSRPDNYSLISTDTVGLCPDSPDGAVSCGGVLYYKGTDGYLYRRGSGGGERISPFALEGRAVAGADSRFCVFSSDAGFTVYDTHSEAFCTEDGSAESFFTHGGSLWYIEKADGARRLYRMGRGSDGGIGVGSRVRVGRWELQSRDFAPDDSFGASPRLLCLDIESDGSSSVYVDFGWDGEFEHIAGFCFQGRLRREIPLPSRRCSCCALRIRGSGGFVLRELAVYTPR